MNSFSKPSILVADLDTAALAQTVRLLSQFDYSAFSAVCYSSAMSATMKLDLDLVICDISIQHCEPGRDLIEDLHQLPGRNDVPVVFTSVGQGPDVIRRQHDFGGAYHIKKPLDPVTLKEIVDGALWLPHLVHSHINRPHFGLAKVPPIAVTDSLPVSNPAVF